MKWLEHKSGEGVSICGRDSRIELRVRKSWIGGGKPRAFLDLHCYTIFKGELVREHHTVDLCTDFKQIAAGLEVALTRQPLSSEMNYVARIVYKNHNRYRIHQVEIR
jgi:hypothetical protein